MKVVAVGDSALKIEFEQDVSLELNSRIQQLLHAFERADFDEVLEFVPSYKAITVYYDSTKISYKKMVEKIMEATEQDNQHQTVKRKTIHVPVLYGGKYGPDLERVAKHNGLTQKEVIELHQQPTYLVYMLGFLPGFPYLGGLDKRIATPRLEEPRRSTFAGAVGIAHEQTGIYPLESPGGWNIIGKTPLKLFNAEAEKPFLFEAGNLVKFYSITEQGNS